MRPEDTDGNASRCLCPGCPTYDDCMSGKSQRLFCSRGRTDCSPKARGCICPECPVYADNDLESTYYCMDGPAE